MLALVSFLYRDDGSISIRFARSALVIPTLEQTVFMVSVVFICSTLPLHNTRHVAISYSFFDSIRFRHIFASIFTKCLSIANTAKKTLRNYPGTFPERS